MCIRDRLVAVGGKEKKDRVMSDKERKIVSYHEVGHALVSALQKNTEPVQKITIAVSYTHLTFVLLLKRLLGLSIGASLSLFYSLYHNRF